MTEELLDESAPAGAGGHVGVLTTWRETSNQAKALLAGVFVSKLAGFIQIFLVLFLTARGFSSGQAGLALGLYGAGAVVGTFIGGSLSDRLSARTATIISMLGSAVLIVSIIYVEQYYLLLLAVLLVSAIGQLYRPAAQSLITELTPANRLVMVTAMYRLCLNLGTTVAPLIGVALVSVSYDLLFWGEALAALVYCVIALRFLPRGGVPAEPAASAVADAAEPDEIGDLAGASKSRSGYLALLQDWRYMTFLAAFLMLCTVYVQYTAVLPLAIIDAGLSTWWYGAVITINGAIVVGFEVLATRFVQTWPLRLTQMSGYALLACGYGIYAIKLVPVLLIIGTLVWTLSEIVGAPTIWAYPGMVAPAHLRGRYFGSMQSMYGLGSTVGPIAGILLYEHVGQKFFLWAAAVMVVATAIGRIGMLDSAAEHEPEPAVPVGGPITVDPAS
ncbi:MFS transporter [Jatrophihabitans sp.]|jgi:predicted MFS family arabinose efflux permease|uniref:MFS transporter n=1 Tax=Jatrophihabitans sp. TaxID=1932789 RepID=UPI002F0BDC32